MKTILVATDFSETANNAAEYAIKLAKEINAKVVLLHVYHASIPPVEAPLLVPSSVELQKEKEKLLQKKADQLKKNTHVEISCITKMGMATEEILEEEKNANMIIMGMKKVGKLSEYILGSITTSVLGRTTIPVLVIPENVKFKIPRKIAFACDYDPATNYETLESLNELITAFKSKLFVINVKNKQELVSVEEAGAGLRLEHQLSEVNHIYNYTENEDFVEGINKFVAEKKADMLAVIPHRHNFLERLFHKSISKTIAFQTDIPLIALPDNHKSVAAYLL